VGTRWVIHFIIATVLLSAAAAAANVQGPPQGDKGAPQTTTQSNPESAVNQGSPGRATHSPESKERRGRPTGVSSPEQAPTPPETTATPAADGDPEANDGADAPGDTPEPQRVETKTVPRFRWRDAVGQSILFLAVQHGYALTQRKTRRDLHGPFFKDYFRSVRSLHGWADGGRFFTNYVAHPLEGSLLGFVQVQSDPVGSRLRFNAGGDYWRSRMKALAWSAAWSTQFEIGPVSQASIGNVGLHGKQTYVDVVMTPTAGLGLLLAEDALDRYLIERLERRTDNRYVKIFSRMVFNPTRTAANLLRFKKPWYRDPGLR
jgi:hypothetical protein